MIQCKSCGSDVEEGARFCPRCGEVIQAPLLDSKAPDLDFVRPAIAGGTFLGLLSSLPLVSAGNCLCCMWIVGGGSIAAIMLQRQNPQRNLALGDGAFAGVTSGVFGALVASMVSIPIKVVSARILESNQASIEEALGRLPELDGPMRDLLIRVLSPEVSLVTVLATLISNLIFFALFAMAGGILTVAVLNRKKDTQLDAK